MIYSLPDGAQIDTDRQLTFEERNFLQKMMIYEHVGFGLEEFRARWRTAGNPVWKGPDTLENPGPAVRIILDLERKIGGRPSRRDAGTG
jgi:hypothetical protein